MVEQAWNADRSQTVSSRSSVDEAPAYIDDAKVLFSTRLDHRHAATGACRHSRNGRPVGPAHALAIAQYPGETSIYLFSCNERWEVITDTLHDSLAEALNQAELEHTGSAKTWHRHACQDTI